MTTIVARPAVQRRPADQRDTMASVAPVRLMMLMLMIAAGVLAIIVQLGLLALLAHPKGPGKVGLGSNPRGDLVDRNGVPLARTVDVLTIGVHPDRLINNRRELAERLAELLPEHDVQWYLWRLRPTGRFTYLKRQATPELVRAINALGEPGIAISHEPERVYLQSTLAAHAIGFVNRDGQGVIGMERVLNDRIGNPDPLKRETSVALSIDSRAQLALESELGAAMQSFHAKGAAGVILDAHTGEVIAMVSLPVFNPNDLRSANEKWLRNNVTQGVYELGSTFKPIAMAAAIDSGVVTSMARRFDAREPIKTGRYIIHDDRGHEQKRWLNIPETLVYSSNISTARIAEQVGRERLENMFRALGFATRPDIELPGAERSLWPGYWSESTTMTVAYGHGISVTPLHLASAYAALVNGGIWRPATMLKVAPGKAPAGRRVISQATSDRLRQLLRLIVLKGTGRSAEAVGYRVGGKTGTAEVSVKGGYERHVNVSTFAAAFPMDAPRYVVVAMVDSAVGNAQSYGNTTAAWTAGPVVSRVIQRTGAMLGVAPDMTKDVDVSELVPLIWHAPGAQDDVP